MRPPFAMICRTLGLICLVTLLCAPLGVQAQQGLFDTVVRVNDGVVTRFEVNQRARLLGVLRRPNATEAAAVQVLIDDRLKEQAARSAGIVPTEEEIQFGLEDFAARANISSEELLIAVSQVGIEPETVRDYVRGLLSWGEVVRERYTARARPSEADIDRAMALGNGNGSARVLLSEIILPLNQDVAAASQERAAAISDLRSFEAFSAAARRFSVAPSRNNGGQLGWLSMSDLPPQIGPILLTLQPGDVTPPIPVDGGIALFQLRALEDSRPPLGGAVTLDYMQVRFPPGTNLASETARLESLTDGCGDLYGVFKGAGEDQLIRNSAPRSELPAGIATVLDTLDAGEIATLAPQVAGTGGSLVMLCERSDIRDEDLSREDVGRQLFLRRLEAFGDAYLAELRAAAFIEYVN